MRAPRATMTESTPWRAPHDISPLKKSQHLLNRKMMSFSRTLVNLTHKFKSQNHGTMLFHLFPVHCISTSWRTFSNWLSLYAATNGHIECHGLWREYGFAFGRCTSVAPKGLTYSGPALSRDGLKLQSLKDLKHQPPKCISANICQYLQYVFYIHLSPISGCMSKIFCPRCSLM